MAGTSESGAEGGLIKAKERIGPSVGGERGRTKRSSPPAAVAAPPKAR